MLFFQLPAKKLTLKTAAVKRKFPAREKIVGGA
jgi:hypothetical protein